MALTMATGRMFTQTSDPTVNEDAANGYEVGNWILNTSNNSLFQCLDNTNGAANWVFKPDQAQDTFTPVLEFGGGSTGITYSSQEANLSKVGDEVSFNIFVALTSKGTDTGNARITGLPYTNGNVPAAFIFYALQLGLPGTTTSFGARIAPSSNEIVLFAQEPNANLTNLTDTEFANNSQLFISGRIFI